MCFSKGGILWRFVIKICLIKRSTEVIRTQWQNFLQDPRITPLWNPIKLEENRCFPNAYTFYKNSRRIWNSLKFKGNGCLPKEIILTWKYLPRFSLNLGRGSYSTKRDYRNNLFPLIVAPLFLKVWSTKEAASSLQDCFLLLQRDIKILPVLPFVFKVFRWLSWRLPF